MKHILIINTGGTFNKVYDPFSGSMTVDKTSRSLLSIATKWRCELDTVSIIGKDSLDMTDEDRNLLLNKIKSSEVQNIIVVHGTDTMDVSASKIAEAKLDKRIIFTGAMVPYAIEPVEAAANLALAFGYLQALDEYGVYIAMNGSIGNYHTVIKDKERGRFRYIP